MKFMALGLALGGLLSIACGAETGESKCPYSHVQSEACFAPHQPQPEQEEILAFEANWCAPCRQMEPLLDNLEQQGFTIQRIDVDQNHQLVQKYHVSSIPTVIRVENGVETGRLIGVASGEQLCRLTEASPAETTCSKCPACHCNECACVPAATRVQPLLRATYDVSEVQAKVLVELLKQNSDFPIEAQIESQSLTITTTPAAQRTLGAFVNSFLNADSK